MRTFQVCLSLIFHTKRQQASTRPEQYLLLLQRTVALTPRAASHLKGGDGGVPLLRQLLDMCTFLCFKRRLARLNLQAHKRAPSSLKERTLVSTCLTPTRSSFLPPSLASLLPRAAVRPFYPDPFPVLPTPPLRFPFFLPRFPFSSHLRTSFPCSLLPLLFSSSPLKLPFQSTVHNPSATLTQAPQYHNTHPCCSPPPTTHLLLQLELHLHKLALQLTLTCP